MPDQPRTWLDKVRDVFGRPGKSLPTPNVNDFVVVESFTNLTETNWLLPYSAPHPKLVDATNAPLLLIKQTRTQGTQEGQYTVTRVYANDRLNQDSYNAQYSFTAKSVAHRIIARSYLVPRAMYTPLAELSPDSVFTSALCTDETAAPAEDPYTSRYFRVNRTWEDFGSLSAQDSWNRRDSLPYLLATYPKITRIYRVPANNDPIAAGALVVGTSVDSSGTGALLTSIARQDESVRVRVYTCVFDSYPSTDALIASGLTGSLGVAVTYPYVDTSFPRVTWTYLAKDAASQKIAPLSACPIPGYTNAVLISQEYGPNIVDDAPTFGGTVTRIYERIPTIAQQAADGGVAGVGGLKLSIDYPYGDTAFPVLSMVVSLLNDTYAPLAVNAACPVPNYTSLVLTDEKRTPDETDRTKTTLTLEYQILPGCVISATDAARLPRTLTAIPPYYLNGDLLTTTVQLFPYLTAGVPTVADSTTLTILSSKIEPHGKWYVTKTNVSRANPTLPVAFLPKQVDAADGADGVEYRMVVQVTDPTLLQAAIISAVGVMNGLTGSIIDYRTSPISPTAAELVYTLVNAFPLRTGQEYDAHLGVALPYTEQIMTAAQAAMVAGNANTTITPVLGQDNLVRVRVSTPPTTFIDAFIRSYARRVSISLPDVFADMQVNLISDSSPGLTTETGDGTGSGPGWSQNISSSGSAEASAALTVELTPIFASRPPSENLKAEEYFIYIPTANAGDESTILTRLNTLIGPGSAISGWPLFTPRVMNFSMFSQRVSVRANASARVSASGNAAGDAQVAKSQGGGYSGSKSTSIRTLTTRECLHGEIDIEVDVTVLASATARCDLAIAGAHPIGAGAASDFATAAVTPSSYPGTGAYTSLPITGKFALHLDVEDSQFTGRAKVRVVVFDFAQIGAAITAAGELTGGNAQPATTVPSTPAMVNVTNVASPGQLIVRWNLNPAGEQVFEYIVEQQESGGAWGVVLKAGSSTAYYIATGLDSGQTYAYRISAVNAVGSSPTSAVVSAIPN